MADEIITLTVPDAHVSRALTANNNLDGKTINVSVHGPTGPEGFKSYKCERAGGETNRQFASRMAKKSWFTVLFASENQTDRQDYTDDVAAIPDPVTDMPEDVVQ